MKQTLNPRGKRSFTCILVYCYYCYYTHTQFQQYKCGCSARTVHAHVHRSSSRPQKSRRSTSVTGIPSNIRKYYPKQLFEVGEIEVDVDVQMNNNNQMHTDLLQTERNLIIYEEESDNNNSPLVIDGLYDDKGSIQDRHKSYSNAASELHVDHSHSGSKSKSSGSGSKSGGSTSTSVSSHSNKSFSSTSKSEKCYTGWTCICDGNTGLGTMSSIKVTAEGPTTYTSNSRKSSNGSHSYEYTSGSSQARSDSDKSSDDMMSNGANNHTR